MNKTSIWSKTKCTLSSSLDFVNNKDIINIIDLRMETQISDKGKTNCLFYVLDIDQIDIDNKLFNFDVKIEVPEICKHVDVSVFGNVNGGNIKDVTFSGII